MPPVAATTRSVASFVRDVVEAHIEHKGDVASAALAFYSILSIAPLLLIAIAVAGHVYGDSEARDVILDNVSAAVNPDVAGLLETALQQAKASGSGMWVGAVSTLVSLFAASRLFAALQTVLNQMWGVRPASEDALRIRDTARRLVVKRLSSFAMVVATGIALAVLLVLRTTVDALVAFTGLSQVAWLMHLVEPLVALPVLCGLIATIFKVLPDARLSWRDAGIGAAVTGVLILAGVYGLAAYFRHATPGSSFGAAGTLVVMVVWAYYSAHIFLVGAQVTLFHAVRYGGGVRPEPHATIAHDLTEANA